MLAKPLLVNHVSNINRKEKKQRSRYTGNSYQRKFLLTKINVEYTLENPFFSKLFRVISIEKKKAAFSLYYASTIFKLFRSAIVMNIDDFEKLDSTIIASKIIVSKIIISKVLFLKGNDIIIEMTTWKYSNLALIILISYWDFRALTLLADGIMTWNFKRPRFTWDRVDVIFNVTGIAILETTRAFYMRLESIIITFQRFPRDDMNFICIFSYLLIRFLMKSRFLNLY